HYYLLKIRNKLNMNLIFFIKSASVNINNYTIKDIPGSSGRLDVISRCILAALLDKDGFEKNIQIWVFLDNYGTHIFNSERFDYNNFPKNEIKLTDYFVEFLRMSDSNEKKNFNPLNSIEISDLSIIEAIKEFIRVNYKVLVLKEKGEDFFNNLDNISEMQKIVFIIGDQEGKFVNSEELLKLELPNISLGTQSYLASSTIRLIKLYLLKL
ncbi:unnamed protein product, partial [marine sediment metagenome]